MIMVIPCILKRDVVESSETPMDPPPDVVYETSDQWELVWKYILHNSIVYCKALYNLCNIHCKGILLGLNAIVLLLIFKHIPT